MPTRLVHLPSTGRLEAVAAHVKGLIANDRSVMLISARRPGMVVLSDLAALGVDTKRVFVLDVTGEAMTGTTKDPDHHLALSSPTLLELIAKRAQKVIRSKAQGRAHVIVGTVNAFATYNDPASLEEIVRYVANHLQSPRMTVDYLVEPAPLPGRLQAFLESFVDEKITLPPGK